MPRFGGGRSFAADVYKGIRIPVKAKPIVQPAAAQSTDEWIRDSLAWYERGGKVKSLVNTKPLTSRERGD